MEKYSVLTYIFNGYEKLHEVEKKSENAEYICVTDDINMKSDTWTIVYDRDLEGKGPFEKCYSVRFNPFKYCNTDICFRVDGSVIMKDSVDPIVEDFLKSGDDAMFSLHPYRRSIIDEYEVWIKVRNYPVDKAVSAVNFFGRLGYNFNNKGFLQYNISIQKNDKINNDYNRICFDILKLLGDEKDIERLDQTIVTMIIDRFFPEMKVYAVSEQILHSKYMKWCHHNTDKEVGYREAFDLTNTLNDKPINVHRFR